MRWPRLARRSDLLPTYTSRKRMAGPVTSSIAGIFVSVQVASALLRRGNGTAHVISFVCMQMPGHAFGRYLGMFTQEVERVSGSAWIEFLCHELCLLLGCLVFHAGPAIEDRQVIMCREVVGVDPLELDKLLHCLIVLMLL